MNTQNAEAKLVISTAVANSRAAPEDRLLVERVGAGLLVVVADGAGGMSGGARAADLLVARVRATVNPETISDGLSRALSWALLRADHQIAADPAAGETTATALIVTSDEIIGASVGDSEAWLANGDDCAHDTPPFDPRVS
jgi:serine/threonine protein phosphatase PrpC